MSFLKTGFDSRVFKMKIKTFWLVFHIQQDTNWMRGGVSRLWYLSICVKLLVRLYKLINVDYIKNLCKLTFGRSKYY